MKLGNWLRSVRVSIDDDCECQNAILMPTLCSLLTGAAGLKLAGEWWCDKWWNERESIEEFAGMAFGQPPCGECECGDDCGPVTLCNVFALLSHVCGSGGGEWFSGFCKPANDRTWSNRPPLSKRAWCSCALARKHAIELFLYRKENQKTEFYWHDFKCMQMCERIKL